MRRRREKVGSALFVVAVGSSAGSIYYAVRGNVRDGLYGGIIGTAFALLYVLVVVLIKEMDQA